MIQLSSKGQHGAVLVIALVLLALMTAIALGTHEAVRVQTRATAALESADISFQLAEAALRAGEQSLVNGDGCTSSSPIGTSPISVRNEYLSEAWWLENGIGYKEQSRSANSYRAWYITGIYGESRDRIYIAVLSKSKVEGATTILRSIYAVSAPGPAHHQICYGRQSWLRLE